MLFKTGFYLLKEIETNRRLLEYFSKKITFLFALYQRISTFVPVTTKTGMKTILVNTYWWWHSVQLTKS